MLVLSRKVGEEVVIPRYEVSVMVIETKGNRVRLGIAAPADVPVHRAEVWDRIRSEKQNAEKTEAGQDSTETYELNRKRPDIQR